MSNYYSKQEAKVRIAHELMKRGWKVYGYHADESDSMTDYYSPAYWNGIAEKNGFILVVDNSCASEAREITKYNPAGNLSFEDREKIEKLEQMTVERGCTEGEEENAKQLIEKIKSKITGQSAYEVVGVIPAYMANPGKCKWHIEKDGKIYDKGTGITKYSEVPESYMFDINKMEYTNSYKYCNEWDNENGEWKRIERTLPEETRKVINDFKSLILRFERVVNNMNTCGDGSQETEQAAQEQQTKTGYEEITITEYKTEIKANEIEKPEELKDGMYFKLKVNFTHGKYKGIVYKINSIRQNPYNNKYYVDCNRLNKKLNKVLTGLASQENSFHCELEQLEKWIKKGSISMVELSEVNTPYEVKKWVKIDKSKNTYNSKSETKQEGKEVKTEETKQEKTVNNTNDNIIIDHDFKITKDVDTRDNSDLWVLKLNNKISYDEFCKVRDILKPVKGNYSKFKSGFIFRYDPTGKIITQETEDIETPITANNSTSQEEQEQQEQTEVNNIIDFEEYKNNSEVGNINNNNSNTINFDDILNQFDNIEISNNNRISADDEKFCKEAENNYKEFIKHTNKYIDYIKENSFKNSIYNSVYLASSIEETQENKKNNFISDIVSYFRNTYKVTLKSEDIKKKYSLEITYNNIVDEIINQLDGYSFTDKAEKELKDEFKNVLKYAKLQVKNLKISIESFFYADCRDYGRGKQYSVSYNNDNKFRQLFKAISHFLYNSYSNKFENIYNIITSNNNDDVFKTHDIANDKIKTLKLYKNGKIDIEFSSTEYVQKFAKEYCGYIEKAS